MDAPLTGSRRDILELLSKQELTALELAERLEITPAGIRQHLAPLEALGWIEREKEVQGAHRPSFRYRLTGDGQRAFPKRYDLLLREILEVLLDRQGSEQVQWIVRQAARRAGGARARRGLRAALAATLGMAGNGTLLAGRRGRRGGGASTPDPSPVPVQGHLRGPPRSVWHVLGHTDRRTFRHAARAARTRRRRPRLLQHPVGA